MSLDMDFDRQDRPAGSAFELDIDLRDQPAGSTFAPDTDRQDRPAGSAAGLGADLDRPERSDGGEVSLDRLADVINEVLAVPSSEGLALLIQAQLARTPAPELSVSDEPALAEAAEA